MADCLPSETSNEPSVVLHEVHITLISPENKLKHFYGVSYCEVLPSETSYEPSVVLHEVFITLRSPENKVKHFY